MPSFMHCIHIQSQGTIAESVLHSQKYGTVIGKTSQGVFLHITNDDQTGDNGILPVFDQNKTEGSILFLSGEMYRGPLTLNLVSASVFFETVMRGWRGVFSSGNIFFEEEKKIFLINSEFSYTWSSDPSEIEVHPMSKILKSFYRISGQFSLEMSNNLLEGPNSNSLDWQYLLAYAGRGRGLTPAGDDFLLGILLVLSRYPVFRKARKILPDDEIILETLRSRTTLLGVNLIQCALLGQADERIIRIADSLMSGESIQNQNMQAFLGWGNTSGISVWQGIGAALDYLSKARQAW